MNAAYENAPGARRARTRAGPSPPPGTESPPGCPGIPAASARARAGESPPRGLRRGASRPSEFFHLTIRSIP